MVFSILQRFGKNSKDAAYATCKPTDSSTAIPHGKFYEMGSKTKVAMSVILRSLIDN